MHVESILTLSPTVTASLVMVTIPTLTCSASPSIVIEDLPTVSTPIILASPSTIKVVLPVPTNTVPTPLVSPIVVTPDNLALRWIFKSLSASNHTNRIYIRNTSCLVNSTCYRYISCYLSITKYI